MNPLSTDGFHHVTMVCTNAQRTLEFYGNLLGLRLVKLTVNFDDPGAYHLYFGDSSGRPGTILTFFEWTRSRPGRWGVGGVHHVALGVGSREAQLMWKRRLQDAGVGVSGPYDRGYFHSIYFADPDGQILEIATHGPGYAVDEPSDALGSGLVTPEAARLSAGRDEAGIQALTHPEPVPEISPEMLLSGIHHVSGITDDLDGVGAFVTETLGLTLVKRTYNQDDGKTLHYFWAKYDGESVAQGSSYTLFGWPDSDYMTRPGAGQTHHIAFRARDEEQQLAWLDHLRGLSVEVTDVQDRQYFKSIYFRAPDGMLMEIATDGPGFTLDEDEASLGSRLQLPPWLEGNRSTIERALTPLRGR